AELDRCDPSMLEDRVDEGRQRRALRKDQQRADQHHDDDNRQQPELLALAHEHPDLTTQGETLHEKISLRDQLKLSFEIAAPAIRLTLDPIAALIIGMNQRALAHRAH